MFSETLLQEGMHENLTLSSNNLRKQFLLLTAHKISNHLAKTKIMHFFCAFAFSDVILYFINIQCRKDMYCHPRLCLRTL